MTAEVRRSLAEWEAKGKARLLWQRYPSLWTGRDEGQWLGWLGITNEQLAHMERFSRIAEAARGGGFSHVLLLALQSDWDTSRDGFFTAPREAAGSYLVTAMDLRNSARL